jgi:hypothetical protein
LKTRLNVRLTLELENNISMASYGDGTNSWGSAGACGLV